MSYLFSSPHFPPSISMTLSYIRVVTTNHLPIGDLVAEAIGGLIGIHRHIQHIRRVDISKGH